MNKDLNNMLSRVASLNEKVELSKVDIELGLLQDASKKVDKIFNDLKKADVVLNQAANSAMDIASATSTYIKKLSEDVSKLEKAEKELGVPVDGLSDLKKSLSSAEKFSTEINGRAKNAM